MPSHERDLWLCPCGSINKQEDDLCTSCRRSSLQAIHDEDIAAKSIEIMALQLGVLNERPKNHRDERV